MQLPGLVQFRKCTLTDKALAEAVAEDLNFMYQEPVTVPARHIPARPDEDFDLITGELIVRFLEKTEIFKQIRTLDIRHKIETGSFFLPQEMRVKIAAFLMEPNEPQETQNERPNHITG
jgi:hypothetical protein